MTHAILVYYDCRLLILWEELELNYRNAGNEWRESLFFNHLLGSYRLCRDPPGWFRYSWFPVCKTILCRILIFMTVLQRISGKQKSGYHPPQAARSNVAAQKIVPNTIAVMLGILRESCEKLQGICRLFFFFLWENAGFTGSSGITPVIYDLRSNRFIDMTKPV